MKKLLGALALVVSSLLVYRYVIDRFRAQLMGAAHPAGAMTAVRVPRRMRMRRPAATRFEYQDATQAVDATWIDEQQLIQSTAPAGDGAETGSKRDRHA